MTGLDARRIAVLAPEFAVELHSTVESTQDLARARVAAGHRLLRAIFADAQTHGRGQRGRVWHSPRGAAIYVTVVWPSARAPATLGGLSLVVGLAVRAALLTAGLEAQLKWPNDVLVKGRKIAGILIEVLPDAGGSMLLIGVGLNVHVDDGAAIDQPWTDVARELDEPFDRSGLAGTLLQSLAQHLKDFEATGLAGFVDAWHTADALLHRPIWLLEGGERSRGEALGIDADGRLRVRIDGTERLVVAGEVSVRVDA
jgi:BirA family biotin operon repressor/biotin-[acetyl-CoA-carboxylase] ligase